MARIHFYVTMVIKHLIEFLIIYLVMTILLGHSSHVYTILDIHTLRSTLRISWKISIHLSHTTKTWPHFILVEI